MAEMMTNDHELYIGSTRKGLKLMRDSKGAAMYSVVEEVPQYKKDLKFSMKSWVGGHGKFEFADDDVYFDGKSIDTTIDGRIILGPLINSVGITGPAALDADPACFCWFSAIGKLMMATTEQVYWYDGTYWVSKNTFTGKTITDMKEYNGILYVALGSSDMYYYTSDGATYVENNHPDGFAEKFFVSPNSAGTANVLWKTKHPNELCSTTDGRIIADHPDAVQTYVGTTYTSYLTEAIDGSATTHVPLDAFATSSYLYIGNGQKFDRIAIDMGTNVNGNASVMTAEYYNGSWTALDITDGTIASAKTLAVDGDVTFTTPSDWATTTVNSIADKYWVRLIVGSTLSATVDINELNLYAGTVAASVGVAWETPSYIGDTSNDINNIFLVNDKLLIGKTDNLVHFDTDGGLHFLLDDLRHNRSTKNFQYCVGWQTAAYFSLTTGLGEIYGANAYATMGPLTGIDDIGKKGTIVGLASDKDWLYVAVDEGTDTNIYKGREIKKDDRLRWEWCPWVSFVSATYPCSVMMVVQHSATDRRLWFGYGHNTAYVILTDNPTADTAARFAPSGLIRFSYTYGTNPYWDKLWQSVVTETRYCASGISVTPKYRKDAETSMTALTGAIITNGVVKTNLTNALTSNRIQFELDLVTSNSSITPEVTYFEVRGTEKPETIRIHDATYSIGTTPTRSVETLRSFLRGGRTSTSLIKFADLRYGDSTQNTTYTWVIILPGYPEEVEIVSEKSRPPELGLRVKFQEIPYTVN